MKFTFLLISLFFTILACTEGSTIDYFEDNEYKSPDGNEQKYISLDSIKELPSAINYGGFSQFIYSFSSGKDTNYLNQFNDNQIDSLNFLSRNLKSLDLFNEYRILPQFAQKIYKSTYELKKILSIVDDGLLLPNMDEIRNGGLRVITKTNADSTSKNLSIIDSISNLTIALKETKTPSSYFGEYAVSGSYYLSTKVILKGEKFINSVEHSTTTKYGNSSIKFQIIDDDSSKLLGSFAIVSPISLADTNIVSDDKILIKGLAFKNNYALIKAYRNDEQTPFFNGVRDSSVKDIQLSLVDSTARAIFFWSVDNKTPYDTNSITLAPIDIKRIDEVDLDMIDSFFEMNHYYCTIGDIPYFDNTLHTFYTKRNLYFLRENGDFAYYGDEQAPNSIEEYLEFAPLIDTISF